LNDRRISEPYHYLLNEYASQIEFCWLARINIDVM
jgi:hypothetical protein